MKRFFALLVILASSTLAQASDLYIKAEGGFAAGDEISNDVRSVRGDLITAKNSQAHLFASGAVGADLILGLSADLSYTYFAESSDSGKQQNPRSLAFFKLGYKAKAQALMANVYYDVLDLMVAKFFIGGGVGYANLGEEFNKKFTEEVFSNVAGMITRAPSVNNQNNFSKNVSRMAYSLSAGASFRLTSNINAIIGYRYFNLGNSGSLRDNNGVELGKNPFKLHSSYIGLKFNL